ncbi:hypothetical protein P9112_001892 [Eukaryota sp. TZLM1-RC]
MGFLWKRCNQNIFIKSSILCQSAFLDGGKNFIYEFSRRFPDDSHLLVPSCSSFWHELSCELDRLPPQLWTNCFPQSIQEIPNRSLSNLQFCCKKLQQKLSKIFESLDFDVRLGQAKKKNPAFAYLLQDMCDSTSSALVTTIPQAYGTLLSDSAWTVNMSFRSFIWPDNLPNLICKCSRNITITHLLNCKHFITFRSKVHDAVRDQLYCMCKSHSETVCLKIREVHIQSSKQTECGTFVNLWCVFIVVHSLKKM